MNKNKHGKRQPQTKLNTRRRVTRCSTRAQSDKVGAQEHSTTPVKVDLGKKIDITESVITIEDSSRKVNLTLRKIEESSYIIEGIPPSRSRTRNTRDENMSRYNDRYYSPRERDYRDHYYPTPPPPQHYERRQVAKKSTAMGAQAHQYSHKRPPGPDYYDGYKRPRMSQGDDYRYNRGMSPPEYSRNGVDSWMERGPPSSSGYRGRGRPPKFAHDEWVDNWNDDSSRARSRSRSSERNRNAGKSEENLRSQSQGPASSPSRGRGRPPKESAQANADKSKTSSQTNQSQSNSSVDTGAKSNPKQNQAKTGPKSVAGQGNPSQTKPAVDKGSKNSPKLSQVKSGPKAVASQDKTSEEKPVGAKPVVDKGAKNSPKPSQAKASPKAVTSQETPSQVKSVVDKDGKNSPKPNQAKAVPKAVVNNTVNSNASPQGRKTVNSVVNNDKSKQVNSSIKLKANARKSTYSPGKVKPSEEQGSVGPDSDVEWKVLSEATGSDSEDARQTRSAKQKAQPDGQCLSALDNALRIERMRKAEEAKNKAAADQSSEETTNKNESKETNSGGESPTKRTSARKSLPSLPNLARKIASTKAKKTMPEAANQIQLQSSDASKDAAQSNSGKHGMARKSARKSSNQQGSASSPSPTETEQDSEDRDMDQQQQEQLAEKNTEGSVPTKVNEHVQMNTTSTNGPVLTAPTTFKPFGPRPTQKVTASTARKSMPASSSSVKTQSPQPADSDCSGTESKSSDSKSSASGSSQSIRTAPRKDTARKSAPPSSNSGKASPVLVPKLLATISILPSGENTDALPEQERVEELDPSQSARTIPIKQLHPSSKNPEGNVQRTPNVQMPTARKSAPQSEQPKRPEIRMPVGQQKEINAKGAIVFDVNKVKAKDINNKLKNILGKVMEAKNTIQTGEISPVDIKLVVNKTDCVSQVVDKMVLVDKKEGPDIKGDMIAEENAGDKITKVKELLPEITKFEVTNDKLKVGNADDQKPTKSEVKSELSTTKLEIKNDVILNVPKIANKVEAKDQQEVKESKEVVDSKSVVTKLESNHVDASDKSSKADAMSIPTKQEQETAEKKAPTTKYNTAVKFVVGTQSILPKEGVNLANYTSTKGRDGAATLETTSKSESKDTTAAVEDIVTSQTISDSSSVAKEQSESVKVDPPSSKDSHELPNNAPEVSIKLDSVQAKSKALTETKIDTKVKDTHSAPVEESIALSTMPSTNAAVVATETNKTVLSPSDASKSLTQSTAELGTEATEKNSSKTLSTKDPIKVDSKVLEKPLPAGQPESAEAQSSGHKNVDKPSDSVQITMSEKSGEQSSTTVVQSESLTNSSTSEKPPEGSSSANVPLVNNQKTKSVPLPIAQPIAVQRQSPARKSKEGYSSDDALLLNSSTNDSADEPMEVDGDSEIEDYLLAEDVVQKPSESSEKELAMDTTKMAEKPATVSAVTTNLPTPKVSEKQSANESSESTPVDTSKTVKSNKSANEPASITPSVEHTKTQSAKDGETTKKINLAEPVAASIVSMRPQDTDLQEKTIVSADKEKQPAQSSEATPENKPAEVTEKAANIPNSGKDGLDAAKHTDIPSSKGDDVRGELTKDAAAPVPKVAAVDVKEQFPSKNNVSVVSAPLPTPKPVNNEKVARETNLKIASEEEKDAEVPEKELEIPAGNASLTSSASDSLKAPIPVNTLTDKSAPNADTTPNILLKTLTDDKKVAEKLPSSVSSVKSVLPSHMTQSTQSVPLQTSDKVSPSSRLEDQSKTLKTSRSATPTNSDKVTPSPGLEGEAKRSRSATPTIKRTPSPGSEGQAKTSRSATPTTSEEVTPSPGSEGQAKTSRSATPTTSDKVAPSPQSEEQSKTSRSATPTTSEKVTPSPGSEGQAKTSRSATPTTSDKVAPSPQSEEQSKTSRSATPTTSEKVTPTPGSGGQAKTSRSATPTNKVAPSPRSEDQSKTSRSATPTISDKVTPSLGSEGQAKTSRSATPTILEKVTPSPQSEEQSKTSRSATPTISDKVVPSPRLEDQSKTSRSATPSGTNDSGAESNFDIIELSSDDDNKTNATSSTSTKSKNKKKRSRPKSSTEQLDGSGKPAGKRSASPQLSDHGKVNKKAKLDEVAKDQEQTDVLSPNLSKQDLFSKLIELKMKKHLKNYMELAAEAKALKEQLAASESSRQKWQIESTRLQIKVHELQEQNDILRSRRKEVPCKVIIATGTQYDRQDVLQAQQLLAGAASAAAAVNIPGRQSMAAAQSVQTAASSQIRMQLQQPSNIPSKQSIGSSHQGSVASDVSRPNAMPTRQAPPTSSPMRVAQPTVNASSAGATATSSATKGQVTPNKQLHNPYGQQRFEQHQPLNLQSPPRSSVAALSSALGGFHAPARTTNKPTTTKRPMLESTTGSKKKPIGTMNQLPNILSTSTIKPKSTRNQGKLSPKVKCKLCMPLDSKTTSSITNPRKIDVGVAHGYTTEDALADESKKTPIAGLTSTDKCEQSISNQVVEKRINQVVPVCLTTAVDIDQPLEMGSDSLKSEESDDDSLIEVNLGQLTLLTVDSDQRADSVDTMKDAEKKMAVNDCNETTNIDLNESAENSALAASNIAEGSIKTSTHEKTPTISSTEDSADDSSKDISASDVKSSSLSQVKGAVVSADNLVVSDRSVAPVDKSSDASMIQSSGDSSAEPKLSSMSLSTASEAKMLLCKTVAKVPPSTVRPTSISKAECPEGSSVESNLSNKSCDTSSEATKSIVEVAPSRVISPMTECSRDSLPKSRSEPSNTPLEAKCPTVVEVAPSEVRATHKPMEESSGESLMQTTSTNKSCNITTETRRPQRKMVAPSGVRPAVPTAKPGDVRAKSSAAKRPSAPVAVIDLTDDDEAKAKSNKGRVPPLNPVRTPPVTQPSRGPQLVAGKNPPVAHSRNTPPRTSAPVQRQPQPNILARGNHANKPGQPQQTASSRLAEFTQAAQQQGQQVQILQTVQGPQIATGQQTLQQRQLQQQQQQQQQQAQRTIATQQVSPNVVISQARVQPMQSRTVTVPAGTSPQIVSLPGNAATATIPARGVAPILQQNAQAQQVLQQVIQPGQTAQIIQTPAGQVVMTPAMSSGVATVLTTQPIQAGPVQYQIQTVNNPTIQQMLQLQQQQQQQQHQQQQQQQQQQQSTARTAQVIGTRFAAPAGTSPNIQQGNHLIHHRGNNAGHPPRMTPHNPQQRLQQPPPPYHQQRRPSFSEPGTVHAIAAPPPTTVANNQGQQTEVQKQVANIQAQIARCEALAQSIQQSIKKLKEEDAPYERRRIEILKQLQMGNHSTYKTQELHMQIRHIQNEQARIQTDSKNKVSHLQQYQHSKYQLQQQLQSIQRQQAVQQGQQQQVQQQTVQQQIVQVSRPTATAPTTATSQTNQVAVRRHPAALPSVPNTTFTVNSNAAPPPKPSLSISKVNQGIVLSWNMTIDNHLHATIDFYNLYAYQETDAPPHTSLWKKIGEVKALPLPMACTLTQFQPGSMYHFAVCAIDIYHRTGPFSEPSSINLPAI